MNHTIADNPDDKELINRILRGDTRAFEMLIKKTERLVAQIVFKMIPTAEDRKDLAQDIYLKVFHHLSGFKFQSKLSTWIARITYNTCLSWIEKKKLVFPGNLSEEQMNTDAEESHYNNPINTSSSETTLFRKELSTILEKEIDALPIIYRTLITLFHHEEVSYEELSQITGLPQGTVKSSLFRARKLLKETILSKYQKEAL